jgi:hypothetical protein
MVKPELYRKCDELKTKGGADLADVAAGLREQVNETDQPRGENGNHGLHGFNGLLESYES